MHFILDGYNMAMRLPELFKKSDALSFEPTREGLVQFLIRYRPQGNSKNRTTIVFDGYAALKVDWNQLRQEAIQIIFSEEESADDRIVSMIGEEGHSPQTLVVTDDRELSLRVRDRQAKVMTIQEFVEKIVEKHKKTEAVHEEPKKKLTAAEEQKITEELKKIWIKKT